MTTTHPPGWASLLETPTGAPYPLCTLCHALHPYHPAAPSNVASPDPPFSLPLQKPLRPHQLDRLGWQEEKASPQPRGTATCPDAQPGPRPPHPHPIPSRDHPEQRPPDPPQYTREDQATRWEGPPQGAWPFSGQTPPLCSDTAPSRRAWPEASSKFS